MVWKQLTQDSVDSQVKRVCYCSCSWTNQMLEVNIKLTSAAGSRPSFMMNETLVVFTYFAHLHSVYNVSCTCFSLENDWEMLCKYWIASTGAAGLHLAKLVFLSVGKSQRKLFRDGSHKMLRKSHWCYGDGLLVNVLLILLAQGYGREVTLQRSNVQ